MEWIGGNAFAGRESAGSSHRLSPMATKATSPNARTARVLIRFAGVSFATTIGKSSDEMAEVEGTLQTCPLAGTDFTSGAKR
jgi:hypothetical protein